MHKYLQIEEYIKAQILKGNFQKNEKIPSETELCEKFNISRHTVRIALSNLSNEGMLYTIQGKGTFVSGKELNEKDTRLIGFGTVSFDYDIFPKVVASINSLLAPKGYNIIINETKYTLESERKSLEYFLEKNVDALAIEPCKSALPNPNIDLYKEFGRRNIPVIFFNGCRNDLDFSSVIADDNSGSYLATTHLLKLGHRNILGVFKMDDWQGHQRYYGYMRAFRDFGLPLPENNVLWVDANLYEYFWDLENKDTCNSFGEIFDQKLLKCTALIPHNDFIACKALHILESNNMKCPGDFSVITYDYTHLTANYKIPLTAVTHPSEKIGIEVGKAMLKQLANPAHRTHVVVPLELMVRESTGPVKSG